MHAALEVRNYVGRLVAASALSEGQAVTLLELYARLAAVALLEGFELGQRAERGVPLFPPLLVPVFPSEKE